MKLRNHKKKIWIILVLVVLVGVSAAAYFNKNRQKLIEVQADKVKRQDLVSMVTASGKIQPKKKVDISASIPGKVVKLAVEEGDRVQKGQFLLQIDPAPYLADVANSRAALNSARSELESARANLNQSKLTFQRKEQMWKDQSGLISQDEYDRSKTDYDMQLARLGADEHLIEQAKANLDRAQDNLDKTTVTSPMTGIIVSRPVEEGEVAVIGTMNNPGTVLMTVADLSEMEAELEVDETDIGNLRLEQKATVTVDAFPNKKFHGTVTEIGNSPIVKGTGTEEATDFKVTITLQSPDVILRPGLTADGEITTATRKSVLTVPIQALVIRDITKGDKGKQNIPKEEREKEGVFLMQNGKAVFRPVKTGIMGEMEIEVLDGLKEGDQIVSGTYQTLRDLKDSDAIQLKKEPKGDGKGKVEKAG